MQYALMRTGIERRPWVLLDAVELGHLESQRQPVEDEANLQNEIWKLAYGAMMWSPDKLDSPELTHADQRLVMDKLTALFGHAFIRLTEDGWYRTSLVQDIEFFPRLPGKTRHVGVAVLIKTVEEIPRSDQFGLTMFPRYGNLDILSNILNRPGLLCLKGEERRAIPRLNPDPSGWRDLIDADRAIRTAYKCN